MNRRQKIIVSVTGIFIVLLILVGLTYAYFLTRVQGNDGGTSISVTTANLAITYDNGNGNFTALDIEPNTKITGENGKTFTVTNDGNQAVEYGVYLEEMINTFTRTSDIKYTLTCETYDKEEYETDATTATKTEIVQE